MEGDWVIVRKGTQDVQTQEGMTQHRKKKRIPRSMIACYGYEVGEDGRLRVHPGQADIVFYIFDSFIAGQSLGQIAMSLEQMGVASPSGKARWSRATLSNILSNEKYVGDVMLGRSRDSGQETSLSVQPQRLLRDHHTGLISRSVFEIAQREKLRRRTDRRAQRRNRKEP